MLEVCVHASADKRFSGKIKVTCERVSFRVVLRATSWREREEERGARTRRETDSRNQDFVLRGSRKGEGRVDERRARAQQPANS